MNSILKFLWNCSNPYAPYLQWNYIFCDLVSNVDSLGKTLTLNAQHARLS